MKLRVCLVIAGALGAALFVAACGDGAVGSTTPPAGTTAGSSATVDPAGWGPPPRLGGNIVGTTPAHTKSVTRAQTKPARIDQPGGICFEANFDGLESGNLQWFRFALDGVELTPELTWFPFSNNTRAFGCYMPDAPLDAGRHTAAVSVQNPNSQTEPTRQVVAWQFEVTP